MKKYLGLFLILFTFIFGTKITLAQSTTISIPTNKIQDIKNIQVQVEQIKAKAKTEIQTIRDNIQNNLAILKTNIKKEKDATKAKIEQTRISGREQALTNFDNTVNRISSLKDQVNTEIAKFEANGTDVTDAKNFMTITETTLTDAQAKIAEIGILLTNSTNQLSAEDKAKLKTLAEDSQTMIKESHQALQNAVKSLKDTALKIETPTNNTVTPNTNPTQ